MMMSNDHSFNARISKVDCSHALRVTVDMPIIWSYSSERCDKAVCVFIGAGCLGVFLACLNLSTCPLGACPNHHPRCRCHCVAVDMLNSYDTAGWRCTLGWVLILSSTLTHGSPPC